MVTVAVLSGSIVMMAYPMLRPEMHPKVDGPAPLHAAAAGRARRLPARGLRELPHPDGAAAAHRGDALRGGGRGATPRPASSPTTTRSSGARSAPARTWPSRADQAPRLLAPGPLREPAGRGAALQHARLRFWMKASKLDPAAVAGAHATRSRWACPTRRSRSPPPAASRARPRWTRLVAYTPRSGTRSRSRRRAGGFDVELDAPNPLGELAAGDRRGGRRSGRERLRRLPRRRGARRRTSAPSLVDDDVPRRSPATCTDGGVLRHHQGRQRREEGARPARAWPTAACRPSAPSSRTTDIWSIVACSATQKAPRGRASARDTRSASTTGRRH